MRKPLLLIAVLIVAVLAGRPLLGELWPFGGTGVQLPAACRAGFTPIGAVQGTGAGSLMAGRTVTVQGVVVGDYQGGDPFGSDLGGYYLQADPDGDALTSDGIFVYDTRTDVGVGDLVRLTGRVSEYEDLTELTQARDVVVCASGVPLPPPTPVMLPIASWDAMEGLEGMLVTFPQDLLIGDYHDFDRYGETVLVLPSEGGARPLQPTAELQPGPAAEAAAELARRSRILLDDGRTRQNPHPARHPNGAAFTSGNAFRGGDVVRGLIGVLDHRFGSYRLQPTEPATVVQANPRPAQPDPVGGTLRVASFNVLNYFTTLTSAGSACGPRQNQECRGADTALELERQRSKIVAALGALDAHVVGLLEMENDRDGAALADLLGALDEANAAGMYAAIDTVGPLGSDVIRVALLYQPSTVRPVGRTAVLDTRAFLDPLASGQARNRPALAQAFEEVASGERFVVVVNHLKSKGSSCGRGDDDALQGNCNGTRAAAAGALLDWLATDPTGTGEPDVLLIGDLNSYDHEEPVLAASVGRDGVPGSPDDFTDLLRSFVGEDAYTYVFDAQLGYLDYALASASLLGQVTGAAAWHINADEPDILDYDLSFKPAAQAGLFTPDPYRSSDHDPVVVGLQLGRAAAGR